MTQSSVPSRLRRFGHSCGQHAVACVDICISCCSCLVWLDVIWETWTSTNATVNCRAGLPSVCRLVVISANSGSEIKQMRVDSCLSWPSCLCSVSRSKCILSLLQSHCLRGEQWEGPRAFPQPRVNSCTPGPDRQKSRLCLQSCWGTVIQWQEIVALSNEAGMLCFGLQRAVFWFQQYIEIKMLYVILKDYRSQKIKARASHVFLQH